MSSRGEIFDGYDNHAFDKYCDSSVKHPTLKVSLRIIHIYI